MDLGEQTEANEREEATVNVGQLEITSSSNVGQNQQATTNVAATTGDGDISGETEQQQETQNISLPEEADVINVNDPLAVDDLASREDQENEQHIENAGIDPNYPLILVRRVSIPNSSDSPRPPSATDSNDDDPPSAMEQENVALPAVPTDEPQEENRARNVIEVFNSISAGGIDLDEEENDEDEDEDVEEIWSEDDEDEAAFLENPNFRGFANQFEAIRNMIAHTRRSMAEAEANFGPIPRNSLMQRFRRILFILNNRRRRLIRLGLATPDVEMPEAEANAEMEAANENDTSDNDDLENAESHRNDEPQVTMEQEEEMNENAVRYDTNIPAQHSYLGANMNRVSGVNLAKIWQHS